MAASTLEGLLMVLFETEGRLEQRATRASPSSSVVPPSTS
ncbi:hypothetical protein DB30_07793 [Enhygromyxa salina]|uniref:Uncharacterized protein n=1 Tax=Enhygromyxa salina TaxID=215803 RepID=A0A0C2A5X3_9BACT|nr:hypothetical protein DB30_07793 [Enhygromyxa salina]